MPQVANRYQPVADPLQLAEDVNNVQHAIFALDKIAPESITTDPDDGRDQLRIMRSMLLSWQKYALHQLRSIL